MKTPVNIAKIFPKYLFWDMDHSKLNVKDDKDIIIPRALYATTPETFEDDISKLEKLYTARQIVKELRSTKEKISNRVCLMVAHHYHVKEFLRFSR
jgi:hypothetical protein